MAFASVNIKFLADLKGFSSQMQNVNRSLKNTSKQLQRTGASLTAGLTLPLAGLGAIAVKTFADFEQEMAKVKAISGATSEQFKALEANAKNLGATTRFTASEVAALQLNFSKLGFDPSEILNVTDATLDLALATGEDLANSAVVAASTLRGFGISASETQRVVDVMAKSFSSSALDLEKFKTAMAVVAPVANTAGASIEQTTGYLSVLVNAGIDASTAGTGLRNIFLDVAKSGGTLEGAMQQILSSTNQNATAMDLFGKRGATVATVLANNITEANKFAAAYNNAGGSAANMAAIMDNTLQGSFFRLKSAVEGAFISIGEQLAPVIRQMAETVGSLVTRFNNLSPSVKKVIVVLGGIAAAIGPLLALAGTILPAIATGFTVLTGPIGLIIAGLTAIGVVITRNWSPIKRTLIDIANYFIDLYNESTVFRVGVQGIINVFKNLFEVGKFIFETLKNIIGGFIDNVINGFKTFGKVVKAIFTGNFSDIPDILKENTKESAKTFKGFTKELSSDWKKLTDGIKQNGQEAIAAITSRQKIEFLKEDVDASGVKDAVKDATAEGITAGLQLPENTDTPEPTGRRQIAGIDAITAGTDIQSPIAKLNEKLPQEIAAMDEHLMRGLERMQAFREGLVRIVEAAAQNIAVGFGQFIAAFASGNASLNDLAGLLLTTIGDMAIQLGKLAIQVGVGIGAIKAALKSLNPAVAIAAGVALIALGSLVKSAASNIAGGESLPAFADGGIVGGSSYYGDKILARVNSGELILNNKQQRVLYDQLSASDGVAAAPLIMDTRISGDDILLVQQRAKNKSNRRR